MDESLGLTETQIHNLEHEMKHAVTNKEVKDIFADDDKINNPTHYQSFIGDGVDCITSMINAFGKEDVAAFCKCNAFKYIWRSSSKGKNEDIEKAIWYLKKYLELGGEDL